MKKSPTAAYILGLCAYCIIFFIAAIITLIYGFGHSLFGNRFFFWVNAVSLIAILLLGREVRKSRLLSWLPAFILSLPLTVYCCMTYSDLLTEGIIDIAGKIITVFYPLLSLAVLFAGYCIFQKKREEPI